MELAAVTSQVRFPVTSCDAFLLFGVVASNKGQVQTSPYPSRPKIELVLRTSSIFGIVACVYAALRPQELEKLGSTVSQLRQSVSRVMSLCIDVLSQIQGSKMLARAATEAQATVRLPFTVLVHVLFMRSLCCSFRWWSRWRH